MEEFEKLATDSAKKALIFIGPVSLDALNTTQLDVLLKHKWKRRVIKDIKEGEIPQDNAEAAMTEKQRKLDELIARAEGKAPPPAPLVEQEPPLFQTSPEQRDVLRKISTIIQGVCERLYQNDKPFC